MKFYSLLLAATLSGCTNDVDTSAVDAKETQPETSRSGGEAASDHSARTSEPNETPHSECLASLHRSSTHERVVRISAFELFNDPLPSASTIDPADANTSSVVTTDISPSCLPRVPFSFDVLREGVLTEGTNADLTPVSATRLDDDFIVFYLHEAYEVGDGEGEAIEVSLVVFNEKGNITRSHRSFSSWYQYEGSIRVRDGTLDHGTIITQEVVYDPARLDAVGNVVEYDQHRPQELYLELSIQDLK